MLLQLGKYFWVALIGLFVDFVTLIVLAELLNVNYLVATVIAFIFGLAVNFVLSEKMVFDAPKEQHLFVRFSLYAAIGISGLLILTLLMWIQVSIFDIQYIFAKCLGTAFVYFWNFFGRKMMYK